MTKQTVVHLYQEVKLGTDLKGIMLNLKANFKSLHIIQFHLYSILDMTKGVESRLVVMMIRE